MDDVNAQGFLKAPNVSQFLTENDCSIYLTNVILDEFPTYDDISVFVSESQLNNKGYLTANNVSNFLTEADLTLDEYCKNSSIS